MYKSRCRDSQDFSAGIVFNIDSTRAEKKKNTHLELLCCESKKIWASWLVLLSLQMVPLLLHLNLPAIKEIKKVFEVITLIMNEEKIHVLKKKGS